PIVRFPESPRNQLSPRHLRELPDPGSRAPDPAPYSHSIVDGGFELISRTPRLIPFTSFTIRDDIVASRSCGRRAQSAVIPSLLSTARIAIVYSYVRASPITPTLWIGSSTANDCHSRRYQPARFTSST